MPRIPYVSNDIQGPIPDQIRSRRSGNLLELDRTLLHNPDFAAGWNQLLSAVRTKSRIPDVVRESVICYIAVLNEAWYEWDQHAPLAIGLGMSQDVMHHLKLGNVSCVDRHLRPVMQLTRELTKEAKVTDELYETVRQALGSDDAVHDLIAVVATYNMVSRYLNALQVGQ